jgi:uncharacterized protein YdeI (YjbR/CyaY-like superfamily)
VEIPQAACSKVGVDKGDRVVLELTLASQTLPAELLELIEKDSVARASWTALSAARQRMLREHILAAKTPQTRTRRAQRALLGAEAPETRRPPKS